LLKYKAVLGKLAGRTGTLRRPDLAVGWTLGIADVQDKKTTWSGSLRSAQIDEMQCYKKCIRLGFFMTNCWNWG